MTAPDAPHRQRISDADLANRIAHGDTDQGYELSLDLRDARAEIAQLRGALATARRGAVELVSDYRTKAESGGSTHRAAYRNKAVGADRVAALFRALALPAEADGGRDEK